MRRGFSRIESVRPIQPNPSDGTVFQTRIKPCNPKDVRDLAIQFIRSNLGYSLIEAEETYTQAIRDGHIETIKSFAYRQNELNQTQP